jgi:hypothetical protein
MLELLDSESDGLRRGAAGKPDRENIKFRKRVLRQPFPLGWRWTYRTWRDRTKCDREISDMAQLALLIIPLTVPVKSRRADGGHQQEDRQQDPIRSWTNPTSLRHEP